MTYYSKVPYTAKIAMRLDSTYAISGYLFIKRESREKSYLYFFNRWASDDLIEEERFVGTSHFFASYKEGSRLEVSEYNRASYLTMDEVEEYASFEKMLEDIKSYLMLDELRK